MNHSFTSKIIEEVEREFNGLGRTIFELSPLLQYINKKTKSANRGSFIDEVPPFFWTDLGSYNLPVVSILGFKFSRS